MSEGLSKIDLDFSPKPMTLAERLVFLGIFSGSLVLGAMAIREIISHLFGASQKPKQTF